MKGAIFFMETEVKEIVCSVCGTKSLHTVITKIQADGVPDMDLRPPEPHRSSMELWVMECPECGYCNGSLATHSDTERSYFDSREYKTLGGLKTENPIIARFVKKALICLKNRDYAEAAQSYLYGAWVGDDENNNEISEECRTEALSIIENSNLKNDDNFFLLRADLLRRNRQFDKVADDYGERFFKVPLMLLASQYQVKLAASKDCAVHKMSEIPGVKYQ